MTAANLTDGIAIDSIAFDSIDRCMASDMAPAPLFMPLERAIDNGDRRNDSVRSSGPHLLMIQCILMVKPICHKNGNCPPAVF